MQRTTLRNKSSNNTANPLQQFSQGSTNQAQHLRNSLGSFLLHKYLSTAKSRKDITHNVNKDNRKQANERTANIINILLFASAGRPGMIDDLLNNRVHSLPPPKRVNTAYDPGNQGKHKNIDDIVSPNRQPGCNKWYHVMYHVNLPNLNQIRASIAIA